MRGLVPTYRFAAAGMAALVVASMVQIQEVRVDAEAAAASIAQVESAAGDCFGAAAIARGFAACPQDPGGPLVPAPIVAASDRSDAYRDDCWTNAPYTARITCTFGTGPIKVALVGNSHAGHWLPTLQVLAATNGWTITTYLISQCNLSDAPLQFDTAAKTANCIAYGRWVRDQTSGSRYDIVITSERQSLPAQGASFATTPALARAGYASYLSKWVRGGTRILVLRDTPDPGRILDSVPDCLAGHPDDASACAGTPTTWHWMDPLADAARAATLRNVTVADLLRFFCTETTCPAAIGSVVVYFDASHMTATYARTLAPYLDPIIARAMRGDPG